MTQEESVANRRRSGRFGTIVTAVLAGVAGGLMAPLILPRLERNLRPATKSLFKTGISLYERGRERAAEMGEFASDMMAEARAEYDAEQSVRGAPDDSVAANEVVRLRNGHAREAGSLNAYPAGVPHQPFHDAAFADKGSGKTAKHGFLLRRRQTTRDMGEHRARR